MSASFRRASRPSQNEAPHTQGGSSSAFQRSTSITKDSDGESKSFGSKLSSSAIFSKAVFERVGTKPSKGGLTLTSSGLRDLDAIIGGGQPLGTAILIEEDRWTQDLALALSRYWSAEAVSQQQQLVLVATCTEPDLDTESFSLSNSDCAFYDGNSNFNIQHHGMSPAALESFISLMPRNLHVDKSKAKIGKQLRETSVPSISTVNMNNDFCIIEENEDFDEDVEHDDEKDTTGEKGDELLQNAWQYKVSVQKERRAQYSSSSFRNAQSSNTRKEYCHSYDLSGRMEDQYPQTWTEVKSRISILECSCQCCAHLRCKGDKACGLNFFKKMLLHIQKVLNEEPNGVVRMLLMNAPVQLISIALPLLLSYIRSHSLPVVVMVTIRPWIRSSLQSPGAAPSLISLRRTCDAVVTCEGFDAIVTMPPPEFSDLAGIFSIRKMALQAQSHFADSTTNRRPPANRFGMKRDRRKLHIRMLHLPPEDYSAGGSSVGSGVRSGAGKPSSNKQEKEETTALQPGLGCASNLRNKSSSRSTSLDF